jgi:hypothetical protein
VLYAQSYASGKEVVDPVSFQRLVEEYGQQKAYCILQVCQIITFTTVMGITLDGIKQRLTFQKAHNHFFRELALLLLIFTAFPLMLVVQTIVVLLTRPSK